MNKTTCSVTYKNVEKGRILKNALCVRMFMEFFSNAIETLQTLVVALGAGLAVWGVVNLLEGYGSDNPGAKSQGIKHYIPE